MIASKKVLATDSAFRLIDRTTVTFSGSSIGAVNSSIDLDRVLWSININLSHYFPQIHVLRT